MSVLPPPRDDLDRYIRRALKAGGIDVRRCTRCLQWTMTKEGAAFDDVALQLSHVCGDLLDEMQGWHTGRSWSGHAIEDTCPCPKAPCGLADGFAPECPHHSPMASKTIRQRHRAEDCPGTADHDKAIGLGTPVVITNPDSGFVGRRGAIAAIYRDNPAARASGCPILDVALVDGPTINLPATSVKPRWEIETPNEDTMPCHNCGATLEQCIADPPCCRTAPGKQGCLHGGDPIEQNERATEQ